MAKKLQNFRQEANLSREALAAATKVSYNTICRAEQQRSAMSLGTAIKLAKFFAKNKKLRQPYEYILEQLTTSHSKSVKRTSSKKSKKKNAK